MPRNPRDGQSRIVTHGNRRCDWVIACRRVCNPSKSPWAERATRPMAAGVTAREYPSSCAGTSGAGSVEAFPHVIARGASAATLCADQVSGTPNGRRSSAKSANATLSAESARASTLSARPALKSNAPVDQTHSCGCGRNVIPAGILRPFRRPTQAIVASASRLTGYTRGCPLKKRVSSSAASSMRP